MGKNKLSDFSSENLDSIGCLEETLPQRIAVGTTQILRTKKTELLEGYAVTLFSAL
jgi:hypothetical protein